MSLVITKDGQSIASVADWFQVAPPKMGDRHWKDGRSAKEFAKAFFTAGVPAVPAELERLLTSSPTLGALRLTELHPEVVIPLDSLRGETRNADGAGIATGASGPVAVTIEAKADEPFGPTIAERLAAVPPRSKAPERVSALTAAVFGDADAPVGHLRYQLLHAVAATLVYAADERASAGVFAVFELRNGSCTAANLDRNHQDFVLFLEALGVKQPETGRLVGPVFVPGGGRVPSAVPLYLGKATKGV